MMNTRDMQPALIAVGCLFLVIGAAVFALMVVRPLATDEPRIAQGTGTVTVPTPLPRSGPSIAWSIAGGASLAIGAALFSLGLNSWRTTRRRGRQGPPASY
jgi:hypothetical protein